VFEEAWSELGGDETSIFEVLDKFAISGDFSLW